ncbi:hypothetical protein [Oceanobacillus rekensis]|uniref:hypothetical protein n=1 Tax=Oceanobacillus rekensis TaxID=937927 RepID=UPI000B42F2FF|nr:hypothetical protein [Oceanobacillus rekensis]
MNINGFARGYMSKNMKGQEFFTHVYGCIEHQLKEWDNDYYVNLVRIADYNLVVNKGSQTFHVMLTEEEIESLMKRGSYALDREIWRQLRAQGLPIKKDNGNYLETVL